MLREIVRPQQVPGEAPRRWFFSHVFDLVVWFGKDGKPSGFQLAYDKYRNEHAFSWHAVSGYRHFRVDDGESSCIGKMTPFLYADGAFDCARVLSGFLCESEQVPADIRTFVVELLEDYVEHKTQTDQRISPDS